MKFNPSKKQTAYCIAELKVDPFMKINHERTKNQPFAAFKYLEKPTIW